MAARPVLAFVFPKEKYWVQEGPRFLENYLTLLQVITLHAKKQQKQAMLSNVFRYGIVGVCMCLSFYVCV